MAPRKLPVAQDVAIEIYVTTTGPKHCDNCCRWLTSTLNGQVTCELFNVELTLDARRKYNPYRRTRECRSSEKSE